MPPQAPVNTAYSQPSTDTDASDNVGLTFYPAYCYKVSPTWFTWVKLTAHDIHKHLQTQSEYRTLPAYVSNGNGWTTRQPLLLFYLNHPIQFVQLVGVVVVLEDYFDKFWLLTLDDGSGSTIDINCRKPDKAQQVDGQDVAQEEPGTDEDAKSRNEAMNKLDIGTVVQVKGQISTFRNIRQIQLDRIVIIKETNQEMRLVAARTDFCRKVLSKPWELSEKQQKGLQRLALGEAESHNERDRRRQRLAQKKVDRERRHAEQIVKQYGCEEQKRQEGAEAARKAGQAL